MRNRLLSVQFINYSDFSYENLATQKQNDKSLTTEKGDTNQKFSGAPWRSARVANRTLFKMRQTQLQMCQEQRTWPKALSIYKSPQEPARDVLRTQRLLQTGSKIIGRICRGTRNSGRNQRYQCRINPPTRGLVNDSGSLFNRHWSHRCTAGQCTSIPIEKRLNCGGTQR